jgi:hypothetical protein
LKMSIGNAVQLQGPQQRMYATRFCAWGAVGLQAGRKRLIHKGKGHCCASFGPLPSLCPE